MQAFHHLHWSNPGVSAGPFMCIVTQAHEFLQDCGLIAFYVVPYPVIYHLVTGLYVRSAFSYLSRLIETRCFMKATEHSLPLWSSLKLFHLLIFHPVPFQSFRVSEDIPLEEEYLRGTVCLLSVFWLKKQMVPHFSLFSVFQSTSDSLLPVAQGIAYIPTPSKDELR